jgi:anti-sigma factor RsiW
MEAERDMVDERQSGMQCTEFEGLLSEAIDGTLMSARRGDFERHRSACEACGSLFAEVSSGLVWLEEMEEVAPPAKLVHNILLATSRAATREVVRPAARIEVPGEAWSEPAWSQRTLPQKRTWRTTLGAGYGVADSGGGRGAWVRSKLSAMLAPVLTARFGLSMGMAFFSMMLVLNMARIQIRELTPHRLSHAFYNGQNKVMKYYQNMRLVVEIESRVRELRDAGAHEIARQGREL